MHLKDWLTSKPISLSLSSGFFGFYSHVGFMQALSELPIEYKIFRGSSAGALVAAGMAAGLKVKEISEVLTQIQTRDFWDPQFGFGYIKGARLTETLAKFLPANFEDLAYPLEVSTFDVVSRQTVVFSSGPLCSVVAASCRIPILFHPFKHEKSVLVDGGVQDHLAIKNIQPLERILCHQLQKPFPWDLSHQKLFAKFDLRQIQLKSIQRSGPRRLHLGPEIIQRSYEQTKLILD